MGDLAAQEVPLRAFTRRIKGLSGLPYWEILVSASLLSSEHCQERYRMYAWMMYAWKTVQGTVPNCGLKLETSMASRRGRTLAIPPLTGSMASIRTLNKWSFQVEAP